MGDDQTVRVWDLANKSLIGSTDLDAGGRAITYSPDAVRIAVGLGGKPVPVTQKVRPRVRSVCVFESPHRRISPRVCGCQIKMDGGFLILDSRDLSVVHEGRDSREWITDIKYNLDGSVLACGSMDGKIYLYEVAAGFSVKGVFSQVCVCARPCGCRC